MEIIKRQRIFEMGGRPMRTPLESRVDHWPQTHSFAPELLRSSGDVARCLSVAVIRLCETRCLDDDRYVHFLRQKAFCLLVKPGHNTSAGDLNQGKGLKESAQNMEAGNLSFGAIMVVSGKRAGFGFTQICVCGLTRPLNMLVD